MWLCVWVWSYCGPGVYSLIFDLVKDVCCKDFSVAEQIIKHNGGGEQNGAMYLRIHKMKKKMLL